MSWSSDSYNLPGPSSLMFYPAPTLSVFQQMLLIRDNFHNHTIKIVHHLLFLYPATSYFRALIIPCRYIMLTFIYSSTLTILCFCMHCPITDIYSVTSS